MELRITEEQQRVEKMNEDKMINALNTNVKLGCLQTHFVKVFCHHHLFIIHFCTFIISVSCLCDGEEDIPGEQRERQNPEEVTGSWFIFLLTT